MKYMLLLLMLIFCVDSAFAEIVTLQEKFSFPDTVSDADGCGSALARARRQALEKVCGLQISGGSGRFRSNDVDDLSLFLFEEIGGRIVSAKTINKSVEYHKSNTQETASLKQCTVVAELGVECDKGSRDPAFAPNFLADVALNETNLREDEAMTISLKAADDMYVTVFQYLPYIQTGKNVFRIFPNELQPQDLVKKGNMLTIPDSGQERKYSHVAQLPKGKEHVVEELMVVATRKRVSFPEEKTLDSFQQILSEIPLNVRREAMIPYRISKKGTLKPK
jgi:hypothetical protein